MCMLHGFYLQSLSIACFFPCRYVCDTLPPTSARFGYATEEALNLRAAVHRRSQCPPKGSGTNMTVEAT